MEIRQSICYNILFYGKLSRKSSRVLILFYLLYINDYDYYCSGAFYKLYGDTYLGN